MRSSLRSFAFLFSAVVSARAISASASAIFVSMRAMSGNLSSVASSSPSYNGHQRERINTKSTAVARQRRDPLTVGLAFSSSTFSDPGIRSNPLSVVMHSSLVRHICHNDRLTYICLLYNLSASSIANGTSLAFRCRSALRENGNKNGLVWSV